MRARECAGFDASSIVPVAASSSIGAPSTATRIPGDVAASGSSARSPAHCGRERKRERAPAGLKRNLDLRFGIAWWRAPDTARSPACAEDSFRAAHAHQRARRRRARHQIGRADHAADRPAGAAPESSKRRNPCTAVQSWFSPGSRRTSVTGACGKPGDQLPGLGRLSRAGVGPREKNAGVGGDVDRPALAARPRPHAPRRPEDRW